MMAHLKGDNQSNPSVKILTGILEDTVRGLVDNEDEVSIRVMAEKLYTNFEVAVEPSDFPKLLGRSGRNIEAVRTIVLSIGGKLGLPACSLYVEDPNPSKVGERRNTAHNFGDERRTSGR